MPKCCAFCGVECDAESFCCPGCLDDLPWIESQCRTCAKPFDTDKLPDLQCGDCQVQSPPIHIALAPLRYAFPVDAAIKALKFRRRLDYLPAFGAMMVATMQELPEDVDALLPVPLHRRRHIRRGFNQAVELSKPIRAEAGLPIISNVLRVRSTPYQSALSASDRRKNLQTAFWVRGNISAGHVLIVDDVITTGATSCELANVLLRAGVGKVSVLALARA